jgi:hypothetical protein
VWKWWDLIVVAIPGIIFLMSLYSYNNTEDKTTSFITNIALNVLFVFSFGATIVLSIIGNIKNSGMPKALFFIIVAALAKIVIAILIPIFVVLLFSALNSGEKDKRYKYGRKGNKNVIMAGIIAAIAALLVGGLIKSGDEDEE